MFKLCDDPYDFAKELGITTNELTDAMAGLFQLRIAYTIPPQKQPQGKWKFGLYREYVAKHAELTTSTTTVASGSDSTSKAHTVSTPASGTTPAISTPLSHPRDTPLTAPRYLPDLQVHPPGRLHRVVLRYDWVLDPHRTYLLREAADEGKSSETNNRFGRLLLSKWAISSKGRLRLFIADPERITEAIEEFAAFCKDSLHFDMIGTFSGEVSIEVGYRVSGMVQKYASCKVRIEVRGYKAVVFFDRSPGDRELEVHAEGKGPPEAIRHLTDMIVVNGALATMLPTKVADEVVKRLKEDMKLNAPG